MRTLRTASMGGRSTLRYFGDLWVFGWHRYPDGRWVEVTHYPPKGNGFEPIRRVNLHGFGRWRPFLHVFRSPGMREVDFGIGR